MFGVKFSLFVIVVGVFCISYCCCDFSELVNIDEIIDNSTLLREYNDQAGIGM